MFASVFMEGSGEAFLFVAATSARYFLEDDRLVASGCEAAVEQHVGTRVHALTLACVWKALPGFPSTCPDFG